MSIIRHIVIHELAHIKHKNHGPDFRNFVQEMDPLMMTNKRRLKKH
jgi:predicted metal-dependent hydrolase